MYAFEILTTVVAILAVMVLIHGYVKNHPEILE